MVVDPPVRVGLFTGLQAGGFIGLFLGFSLAVVSALTQPDELMQLVEFMCITPLLCAAVLGPILAWRRAPPPPPADPLEAVRAVVEPFNEGQGKWRPLSHVRSDGRNVRIDLHNSTQVLAIVAATLPFAEEVPVKYIVGRGEARSREPTLRPKVLAHIEEWSCTVDAGPPRPSRSCRHPLSSTWRPPTGCIADCSTCSPSFSSSHGWNCGFERNRL
jgi:hypothetical protein